jgi:hypothetical protein
MPAPTNTSFVTATDLTSIPQTITQTADFSGTTYDLYFRVPPSLVVTGMVELGIFAFGDLAVYMPTTRFYLGPAGAPTQVVKVDEPAALNVPLQVPITVATEYFIKVATNAGNPTPATLTLLVQAAPNLAIQRGDIVIPDDTVGFPVAILDPDNDYGIRRFAHPFSASEQGDTLHTSGHSLMLRRPTDVTVDHLGLFDETYAYILGIAFSPAIGNTGPVIRSNQTTQKFWVMYFNDPTLYAFSLTPDGVPSAVENLGDVFSTPLSVATSPDETILYFVDTASQVRRWSLVTHSALSDLVASTANYATVDLLVLSNGEVLVGLFKTSATRDFKVKHYDAAGTLLHTYSFGSDIRNISPRLAYSLDNLTTFWVYLPRPVEGANRGKVNVEQVQISDGTILVNRTYAEFETGRYRGAATATPLADFGASNSCPFWIVGTESTSTQTFTIRRQRRWLLPSSDSHHVMKIPIIEILGRGNGLTPGPAGSPVQGEAPILMCRLSKDGGKTWLPERQIPAGLEGQFRARWRVLQATGNYRDAVFEVSVTDPVDWQLIEAFAPNGLEEGSS